MLQRRSNASVTNRSEVRPTRLRTPPALATASAPTKPSAATRFSFDQLLRRMRTKASDLNGSGSGSDSDKPTSRHATGLRERVDSGAGDVRRKLHQTAASIKSSLRPPPLVIASSGGAASSGPRRPATATLCLSPGGRANVTLAIPVTPPSATKKKQQREVRRHSLTLSDGAHIEDDAPARSSFSLGSWRDSLDIDIVADTSYVEADPVVLAVPSSSLLHSPTPPPSTPLPPPSPSPSTTQWVPRDLVPDVRMVCSVGSSASLRLAHQYVQQLLRVYVFEVRATKWAAYFLLLVRNARRARTLSSSDTLSVRFAVCAYVRREAATRHRLKQVHEKLFQHKMTEYRVAMQCICGTSVMKYGRQGKPHLTHLMIENGDTFKWTSAKLLSSKKHIAKKSIALADIIDVRTGPTTDVLVKALQKGTLRLQDAKCTVSLVTRKRTFDIKARSTAEREWLYRSFKFLVDLARQHEKQVAQQVELSIMKKMETLAVWKHGRKGRPHKTRLFINRYGELSWQGRTGDTILLEEIDAIERGHVTQVFQRSRKAGVATPRTAARCFSLVTRTRTLDIETANEHQRDWYVVAIRYLMDKVHEKTAAIKREKAEKQLKMLQELCGGQLDASYESGNVGTAMSTPLHA